MEYATMEDKARVKKKSRDMQTMCTSLTDSLLFSTEFTSPVHSSNIASNQRLLSTTGNFSIEQIKSHLTDLPNPSGPKRKPTKAKKRKELEKLEENTTDEEKKQTKNEKHVSPISLEEHFDRSLARRRIPTSQRKRHSSSNNKKTRKKIS